MSHWDAREKGARDQMLSQVFDLMRAGRLIEAEALCRDLLKILPEEPGLHHLAGLLNYHLGRSELALEAIAHAIALNPNEAEYHNNLSVVLLATGQIEQAIAAGSRAVELRDEYPDAWNNLGNALAAGGRVDESLTAYDRALRQRPDFPEALNNRGNTLRQAGRNPQAIADYERAIALQPSYADAHANLAIAMHAAGRVNDEIECLRRVAQLRPRDYESINRLGATLFHHGQFAEALDCYRRAVDLNRGSAEGFNNLGLTLQRLGKFAEAIAYHRRALEPKEDYAEALTGLGAALRQCGELKESIECHERALALQPESADAMTFLGAALQEEGNISRAMALQRQAICIRPDHAEAHLNLAFMLLARGEMEEGWSEYEWRLKIGPDCKRTFCSPRWRGEDLAGARLFVHGEQGLGDTIQFVRYVPALAGRGATVILESFGELERLFGSLAGVSCLTRAGAPEPEHDLHVPLLSLPMAFATTVQSIPGQVPYLRADRKSSDQWAQRLSVFGGEVKVGLAWAGRATHFNDRNRSVRFELLRPLWEIEGVRLFSVQKELASPASHRVEGMELVDWTHELADFADTAALVSNLDLVITVDTAIAHLAGALGKPCWVLLPHPADFRWLLEREDSPWYPSVRLFRQKEARQWEAPIARVAEALRCFRAGR